MDKEKSGQYSNLCGNHRFVAARDLGIEKFPCIVYQGSREMLWPALKDMVYDLDTGDFDIELT